MVNYSDYSFSKVENWDYCLDPQPSAKDWPCVLPEGHEGHHEDWKGRTWQYDARSGVSA